MVTKSADREELVRHSQTLFSHDKPDRFFTVIKFWMDETSGVALALKAGLPTYQVDDDEGRSRKMKMVNVDPGQKPTVRQPSND